jgi:glucose/arabinose dehydrogenase
MVVRLNRSIRTYPEGGSQTNFMTETNGSVVVNYNLAVVRVTATGMRTLATARQIAKLVPNAIGVMGGGDVAASPHGTVYAVESVLARPHGCTTVIAQINPDGTLSALWRSAPNQTCF